MTWTVPLAVLACSLPLAAAGAPDAPQGGGQPPAPAATTPAAPAASPTATPAGDLSTLLAESDEAYAHRDDPAQLAIVQARLAEAAKLAPADYGVLWRLARVEVWRADDPKVGNDEKKTLGKLAWDYGDRATAADPKRVEGWYWSAAGMGMYGLGIGVFTALRQGIEPKFKERLGNAEKIDPGYDHGAIQTAWGRFYYKLPWPKYDAHKSEQALVEALRRNPDNVRAHVYLADLFGKEHRGKDAHAQLEAAIAKPPGQYDPPEERRWQEQARRLLGEK